jgi:hypothetical protein
MYDTWVRISVCAHASTRSWTAESAKTKDIREAFAYAHQLSGYRAGLTPEQKRARVAVLSAKRCVMNFRMFDVSYFVLLS